jgi:hypothetical protein
VILRSANGSLPIWNISNLSRMAAIAITVCGTRKAGIGSAKTASRHRSIGTSETANGFILLSAACARCRWMHRCVTSLTMKRPLMPSGARCASRPSLNGRRRATNLIGDCVGNGRTRLICHTRDLRKHRVPSANTTANS